MSAIRLSIVGLPVLIASGIIQGAALLTGGPGPAGSGGARWLSQGAPVAGVRLTNHAGNQRPLSGSDTTLVLVFDPECPHSKPVMPLWRAWLNEAQSSLQVLAVSVGSPEQGDAYLEEFGWTEGSWGFDTASNQRQRQALSTRTPWVYLVAPEGVVLRQGHGRLIQEVASGSSDMSIGVSDSE